MYSIKAVTTLTGLTPETLRAWERRYDCITPNRSDSGRRSYSQGDLEKLKLLVSLTRQGHPIGKIAAMSCDELRLFQQQSDQPGDNESTMLFEQILDALKEYRIERCEQLLKRALIANEPLDYAREILFPALQKVGQLWHEGVINIAQEHMFSSCVKRIVMTLVNNVHQPSDRNPKMLFATPSGEPHEFGILLSCLVAASRQFNCLYLGADVPAEDVMDACEHLRPGVIVLGLVKVPPEAETVEQLELLLKKAEKAQIEVWLGGAGAYQWWKQRSAQVGYGELLDGIDHFDMMARHYRMRTA